jgi:sterol-4alpha-carboxylate 3-dehydrogenase (decarboxylating)
MEEEHYVVVTGGTGFVGRWIVKSLIEQHPEFNITIVDLKKQHQWETPRDNIKFIKADITKRDEVISAFELAKPTIVIHSAGIVPTGNDRYTPTKRVREHTYDVNVNGTRYVLDAAQAVGVDYFVFTSSVTIVSDDVDHDYPNMDESVPVGYASLIYGRCKVRHKNNPECHVDS